MNVLGIAGRHRHAAAALAVDGAIAAAASEETYVRVPGVGYDQTGGFPSRAVEAVLMRAGLTMADVNRLAIVDDAAADSTGGPGPAAADVPAAWRATVAALPVCTIDPVDADARLSAAVTQADDVLVFTVDPPAVAAYGRTDGELRLRARAGGVDRLVCAARSLARALGASGANPFLALDRLSGRGECEFVREMEDVLRWDPHGVIVDQERLARLTHDLVGAAPTDNDLWLMNIKAQQRRSALAASFMDRLATVVHDATRSLCGERRVCLGGALFASSRLNTRLVGLLGDGVTFAPIPESAGRAIGAVAGARGADGLAGLGLGATFTESEIKATLENCRLDYVYEPDWRRLLARVSRMLSRGMVVGWFQGPTVFGPRSLGTRSVLCDPSTVYARENVNEYLKRRPLDEPLPVSFVPGRADQCLATPVRSPFMLLDAVVKTPWRDRVRAALDHRHELRLHTITADQAPELVDLLDVHFERAGVPGLINTTLSGPGEPIAGSPRDAVRTVYSSAIDALVIGRFLLMKDYWLLRSDAN
jgi:predicted NodU family carbamoyl transferase